MKPKRLAAIDIGSNSIRCIVVEARPGGRFQVLDDEKATVRLGEGLTASGRIAQGPWERAREALVRMKQLIDGLGVQAVEAVATSAVREAANGADFIAAMGRETGIPIRVISGEEEAELAALSARHHFEMANSRYVLADIGGGSLEVVIAAGQHIERIFSLELGAVVLTERFFPRDPIPSADLARLCRHVRSALRDAIGEVAMPVGCLIGSGGTMTAIGQMVMELRGEHYSSVHGYEVLRSEVVHLLAMLQRKNRRERLAVAGLNPERADIIVAGVAVTDELMRHFDANLLRVNAGGLREGLIYASLAKHGLLPAEETPQDWHASVLAFARTCHSDEEHAHQVATLALAIFAPLAESFGLSERHGQILEAAALLHDVGYFISYSQHHKHSYHLIRHATLFGFSPRERELIANIARYHRKAMPKKKHLPFAQLDAEDRQLVRRLGGILRVADGLDRRRSALVRSVVAELSPSALTLRLSGADDLAVEMHGARAKADLFSAAFARELVLEHVASP
jgi:exopolyphosphatase/guanosine-5'-triphosphate,3'-diphosphate pyrophosphatase